jgi:hypothetical protein
VESRIEISKGLVLQVSMAGGTSGNMDPTQRLICDGYFVLLGVPSSQLPCTLRRSRDCGAWRNFGGGQVVAVVVVDCYFLWVIMVWQKGTKRPVPFLGPWVGWGGESEVGKGANISILTSHIAVYFQHSKPELWIFGRWSSSSAQQWRHAVVPRQSRHEE